MKYASVRSARWVSALGAMALLTLSAEGQRRLNGPLTSGGNVNDFAATPDTSLVVYRADQLVDGRDELFVVPSDGGPAQKLSHDLAPGSHVDDFVLTPDGLRAIYEVDLGATREFHSARLERATRAERASGTRRRRQAVRTWSGRPDLLLPRRTTTGSVRALPRRARATGTEGTADWIGFDPPAVVRRRNHFF